MVTNKRIIVHFTVLTFCIAYLVAGSLIVLGKVGYRVYGWVNTLPQFCMNIPFAIYILSPAIASYIVLKKNNKTINLWKWLKTVFYVKNNVYPYAFVAAGLVLYFSIHAFSLGRVEMVLPFYAFFLSIPGNLFIGGLEEAGWAYILQPALAKRFGYIVSCIITGIIWIAWHIPLFFIPGTTHEEGLINFGMFAVQCMALRFFFSVSAALRSIDPPALDCSNGRSKKKGGFIRRPLGVSYFSLSVSAATAPHMPQALQSSPWQSRSTSPPGRCRQ